MPHRPCKFIHRLVINSPPCTQRRKPNHATLTRKNALSLQERRTLFPRLKKSLLIPIFRDRKQRLATPSCRLNRLRIAYKFHRQFLEHWLPLRTPSTQMLVDTRIHLFRHRNTGTKNRQSRSRCDPRISIDKNRRLKLLERSLQSKDRKS